MAKDSRLEAQERLHARSYKILEEARIAAARTKQYDTEKTRRVLQEIFHTRFGRPAYEWQMDVTEAMLLGLDSIVIARTGAGKTMPFMMPLLLDSKKKVIIISPLKVLQEDQVSKLSNASGYLT